MGGQTKIVIVHLKYYVHHGGIESEKNLGPFTPKCAVTVSLVNFSATVTRI